MFLNMLYDSRNICLIHHFLVGEMSCFVTNQSFILRGIVVMTGDSHIDCVALTSVAPPSLDNDLPGNYPSSQSGNLSDNEGIRMTKLRLL